MDEALIILSDHAVQAITERELSETWVRETVVDPEQTDNDPNHSDRWRVYRRITERGGRVLRVVCTMRGSAILVITAHFDRSKRI